MNNSNPSSLNSLSNLSKKKKKTTRSISSSSTFHRWFRKVYPFLLLGQLFGPSASSSPSIWSAEPCFCYLVLVPSCSAKVDDVQSKYIVHEDHRDKVQLNLTIKIANKVQHFKRERHIFSMEERDHNCCTEAKAQSGVHDFLLFYAEGYIRRL